MARPSTLPIFFAKPAELREWFRRNASTATELVVGYYKVGSGRASITWPESVDEALCYGWIDSVRHGIDERSYQTRFTPRRKGSTWSKINIARAQALIAEGRMTSAGLKAFEARLEKKSGVYSYENETVFQLTAEEERELRKNRVAWAAFQKLAPSRRKQLLHLVCSAKSPETRARRLAKFIADCSR